MDERVQEQKADPETVHEITRLLGVDGLSGVDATAELMPLVYEELRRLAAYRLSQEKPGQTLQATALVNEVYLRLVQDSDAQWENKRHFFVAAAEAMRRILIENARKKNTRKRGGGGGAAGGEGGGGAGIGGVRFAVGRQGNTVNPVFLGTMLGCVVNSSQAYGSRFPLSAILC